MDLCTVDMKVPFSSDRDATIAYNSLRVDPEPKRSGTKKTLSVDGSILSVVFTAKDAKSLRVGVNGFMDLLLLTVETIEKFGHQDT